VENTALLAGGLAYSNQRRGLVEAGHHHVWVNSPKGQRLRTVFGSNRQPGVSFRKGVPALSVRGLAANAAPNVYPHNMSGRYVTIHEFLTQTLANPVGSQAAEPEKSNE
jgi:hypothetical protein